MNEPKVLDSEILIRLGEETSPALIPKLTGLYITELGEALDILRTQNADDDSLRKMLHKAKNSSATFGATALNVLVIDLEAQLIDGISLQNDQMETLIETAESTLVALRALATDED